MKKKVIGFSVSIILLMLIVFLFVACSKPKNRTIVEPYWYLLASPWKELDGNTGDKFAYASILKFSNDGEYARVACGLTLQKNGRIYIGRGDGWDIYLGTWSWKGDSLLIKSRMWYAMNSPLGYKYPTQNTEEIGVIDGNTLTLGKDKYAKGLIVDAKDVEYLINGAKTARKE